MNVKLNTPKNTQMSNGDSSMKQFLLSLLATTISIALTFGVAAIIDYYKKKSEKHEIVMMVMYDMYNSLQTVEKADLLIRQSMELQGQLAADTTRFEELKSQFARTMPMIIYNETTEHIFSSSIETINTVGNVLFTENVAGFYQIRQLYKTMVCDSIAKEVVLQNSFSSLNGVLDFDYLSYGLLSVYFLDDMQRLFDQCKQMMDITDKEIEAYRKEREQMDDNISTTANDSIISELMELQQSIDESKAKLKKE